MPAGLLLVFSDPGPAVTEAEYNDWNDNEHVPLRIPIPTFHSWSRWVAVDGKRPGYFALYHMTSADAVNELPYSALASTRSEREKDIISRLAVLDRRTYDEIPVSTPPRTGDAYDVRAPGPFVSVVSVEVTPELEEELKKVENLQKSINWDGKHHGEDNSNENRKRKRDD